MQTLVIAKPACMRRGLLGELIGGLERRGLVIADIKKRQLATADVLLLYPNGDSKTILEATAVEFTDSHSFLIRVLAAEINVVAEANELVRRMGHSLSAKPGFLAYTSATAAVAERELGLFFGYPPITAPPSRALQQPTENFPGHGCKVCGRLTCGNAHMGLAYTD